MLIRITNRCQMGCNHCMVDAQPDGEHMTVEMFKQALEFSKQDWPILLISGGEPSEHPEVVRFLELAQEARFESAFLTNGMYLIRQPELAAQISARVSIGVQVTNDPRYYPERLSLDIPTEKLRTVAPFGRARKAGLQSSRLTPFCFNLRSTMGYFRSFQKALMTLRQMGKMCSPSINVDGTVVAGEAPECARLGTVWSSEEEVTTNLMCLKCNRCGLMDGLDRELREVVGEA